MQISRFKTRMARRETGECQPTPTSIPENACQSQISVDAFLSERGYPDAQAVHTAEESLIFALPPELRRDLRAAARG